MAESLKGKVCTSAIFNQYGFKVVKDEVTELTGELKYYSEKHHINIECSRGVIKKASYDGESLNDINDAKLIQPNEKGKAYYNEHVSNYIKEIKEDFASWKLNNMSKTVVLPDDGKSIK